MPYPSLTVNVDKIARNAQRMVDLCRAGGISVMGVVKAVCGDLDVVRAFVKGGVDLIGDSRLQNLARFRTANIDKPLCLLRLPMISEARELVRLADMCLISEIETAKAISKEAVAAGSTLRLILMVDMGDLREGVLPQKALRTAKIFAGLPGLELHGLGANFACYGGILPTFEKLTALLEIAEEIRRETGCELPVVSGGNSSGLYLLPDGVPPGVNQLRIGEGILLGRETSYRRPIPGLALDAFMLHGEIIELQEKPSAPEGLRGTDAFGRAPTFQDKGVRRRAIVALGRHDVLIEGLTPEARGAEIIGASSDHLLLDVTEVDLPLGVGSILKFEMRYGSLISAMMSSYITKVSVGRDF